MTMYDYMKMEMPIYWSTIICPELGNVLGIEDSGDPTLWTRRFLDVRIAPPKGLVVVGSSWSYPENWVVFFKSMEIMEIHLEMYDWEILGVLLWVETSILAWYWMYWYVLGFTTVVCFRNWLWFGAELNSVDKLGSENFRLVNPQNI